jgi:hypothetical protein
MVMKYALMWMANVDTFFHYELVPIVLGFIACSYLRMGLCSFQSAFWLLGAAVCSAAMHAKMAPQ